MMVGARTAAWAKSGAPLPYDAEVEWIRPSNKNAYIDLNIIPSFGKEYSIRFSKKNYRYIGQDCPFGGLIRNPTRGFQLYTQSSGAYETDTHIDFFVNTNGDGFITGHISPRQGVIYDVRMKCELGMSTYEISEDGGQYVLVGTTTTTSIAQPPTIHLPGRYDSGKHDPGSWAVPGIDIFEFYGFSVKDLVSGEYDKNFIPCIATFNGKQEACFYEEVSGVFHRNESQVYDFVAGPRVS